MRKIHHNPIPALNPHKPQLLELRHLIPLPLAPALTHAGIFTILQIFLISVRLPGFEPGLEAVSLFLVKLFACKKVVGKPLS
jgi:hypothetical protein